MSNPELATKVAISLERMDDEMKERRAQEEKEGVRAERRAQAMAVVEAVYDKINSGIAKGSEISRATNRTNQTRSTQDPSDVTTLADRSDPITRFKHAIDQPSTLDVT
jgi:hypothetical protein